MTNASPKSGFKSSRLLVQASLTRRLYARKLVNIRLFEIEYRLDNTLPKNSFQ